MKEFLLVYRVDYSKMKQVSPEEMQANTKRWMDWIGGIAAQDKLSNRGNRLVPLAGKVLKSTSIITDGPYAETKESINGYSIIKTDSIEEAVDIAKGCPLFSLNMGGSVEVREISAL